MFPSVLTLEMSGFDIDLFLPALFFAILAKGKGKARQVNDPKKIADFIDQLAHHPILQGFDSLEGRKVLERLVRTTLITTSKIGRAHTGEQISSIIPYTLLSHKPGFPATGSRQRKADTFIYQALRECIRSDNKLRTISDNKLRTIMETAFGHGVEIGKDSDLGGAYDGETDLDTLTRLSIAFLDGFENTKPGLSREEDVPSSCPALFRELGTDILDYLSKFCTFMPTQAFTYHLLALINFELFNYTLKLVHAINALVRNPETLPEAMRDEPVPSSPQLYLDFTGASAGRSLEMAKACVRRDVEAYQQFLSSNLLLRQLDRYVEDLKRNQRRKVDIEKMLPSKASGAHYLQGLLLLQNNPNVQANFDASAQRDENRIIAENTSADGSDDTELLMWLDTVASTAETDVERVVNLLAEAQHDDIGRHFMPWYWGVGGMRQPHGVLTGHVPQRQSWRYAPSNDLLAVLVQVVAARLSKPNELQSIRLQEFLKFLENRFGILIDKPPTPFEGTEYAAAARDNLRAMLRRLRQMGIFRDLSDDFTVQRLHPPYVGEETIRVEA